MCGIAGIRRFDGSTVPPSVLAEMAASLTHRGPDDSDAIVNGAVGLAHTRLAIIDLGSSRQPMTSTGGRSTLVFNGEILNYRDLRTALDYPFRTSGDTEVLLALYDRYGPAGVQRLRGQFAYAIHDSATGETHLFRDRLGILPLYYHLDRDQLVFASEPKALFPAIGRPRLDEASLYDYLAHRSVPSPYSFYDGVRKVPPGHYLTVGPDGDAAMTPYWTLPAEQDVLDVSRADAIHLVDEALTASVRDSLVADVPVGSYLSGGLDSSLITALAARERDGGTLHTFSAGFGDSRLDETRWARAVADQLGTVHHEVHVTADDFATNWDRLSLHRDAPLSEPADVAVFRLAQSAREQVKVVLSGEGSDELFAGYPKYRFARPTLRPGPLGPLGRALDHRLPPGGARLRVAARALSEPDAGERMRAWFAPFTRAERETLIGRPPVRTVQEQYRRANGDPLYRMLYADCHTWLSDNLLERGDRMSMAASLELRPPFLDHRLVELAFALPSRTKIHRGTTKWIVKEIARMHLPNHIVDRPKVGFKVPLDDWFRTGLRDLAHDALLDPSSFVASAFDRNAVAGILSAHSAGSRDEQSRIWTLLSLEMWHRQRFSHSREYRSIEFRPRTDSQPK